MCVCVYVCVAVLLSLKPFYPLHLFLATQRKLLVVCTRRSADIFEKDSIVKLNEVVIGWLLLSGTK